MLPNAVHEVSSFPALAVVNSRRTPSGRAGGDSTVRLRRFLPDGEPQHLEELFQQARQAGDNCNAAAYFERLAEYRHRELTKRPEFDITRPSIITSFQPKSGGTFLHNRLLEIGYQEYWWGFPHAKCHSHVIATERTLELYLRGGAACHTHCRPEASLLSALDRLGVERIWVHLRNPIESAVSAFHHYRGEGHGEGEAGEQRRRAALETARTFSFRSRYSTSHFVRKTLDWLIEWVREWLQFEQDHPGLVLVTYHRDLSDLQGMMQRVMGAYGTAAPASISTEPTSRDRFRKNPHRDWRESLNSRTQRFAETRLRESLGKFRALEYLWT
jgi:hypothetical protein